MSTVELVFAQGKVQNKYMSSSVFGSMEIQYRMVMIAIEFEIWKSNTFYH